MIAQHGMVTVLMQQVMELSATHVQTTVLPATSPVRMVMATPKPEMSKIFDATVDHGLMILPVSNVYTIVTAGSAHKGIRMLAHVMRWVANGSHANEFFRIMNTLEAATKYESL